MKTFNIIVTDFSRLYNDPKRYFETTVKAVDKYDAQGKGIAKLFGKHAFWNNNIGLSNLPSKYGQVFRALDKNRTHATSVTGNARLEMYEE